MFNTPEYAIAILPADSPAIQVIHAQKQRIAELEASNRQFASQSAARYNYKGEMRYAAIMTVSVLFMLFAPCAYAIKSIRRTTRSDFDSQYEDYTVLEISLNN